MAAVEDLEEKAEDNRRERLKQIANLIEADIMRLQFPADCRAARQVQLL